MSNMNLLYRRQRVNRKTCAIQVMHNLIWFPLTTTTIQGHKEATIYENQLTNFAHFGTQHPFSALFPNSSSLKNKTVFVANTRKESQLSASFQLPSASPPERAVSYKNGTALDYNVCSYSLTEASANQRGRVNGRVSGMVNFMKFNKKYNNL